MLLRKFNPLYLFLLLVSIASCEKDEVQTECMDFNLVLNEEVEPGSDIMVVADELLSSIEGATYTWIVEEQDEKHEISGDSSARLNWSPKVGETQFCLMVELPGCDGSTACFTYTLDAIEDEEVSSSEGANSEDSNSENDNSSSSNGDSNEEENTGNTEEENENSGSEEDNGSSEDEDPNSESNNESENGEENNTEENNSGEDTSSSEDETNNNSEEGTTNEEEGSTESGNESTDESTNEGTDYSPNCLGDMQRIFLTSCHFRIESFVRDGNDETISYTSNNTLVKFNTDGSMDMMRFTGTANEISESFGSWGSLSETCQLQINPSEASHFSGIWNFEFSADGNTLQLVIDENNKAILVRNCNG
ncbi:hypothetical protein [Croceivirga thetidis]|uniref:Uncharacterized protein n=1 Tax=Croceivirga thetidis TaxID=2721623 RepID=A0ABX1GT39_9FLAO|nr:hypothetical protein [Croceivirga thetidis]NKI33125.1 hypothetical protein [Croceivirga thetidis]